MEGGSSICVYSNKYRNWELVCLADISSSCSVAGTPSALMSSKYHIIFRRYSLHVHAPSEIRVLDYFCCMY